MPHLIPPNIQRMLVQLDHVLRGLGPRARVARVLLSTMALVAVLCAAPSLAEAKGKTVAVLVDGPDAESVRTAIVAAVPRGTAVADAAAFKSALADQGVKTPFGKALEGGGREKTLAHVRKAAAAVDVDGTLIAHVTKSRRERHVGLLLVATAGAAGDLEDEVVLGLKPSKEDDEKLASSIGTALVDYRSAREDKPSPPTKEPSSTDEATPGEHEATPSEPQSQADVETSKSEHPHGVAGHELFNVDLGAGGMGRHFGYTVDPATSSLNLRPYTVLPAAMVAVHGEVYPLADSQQRALRDFGVVGAYSRTLFLQSNLAGGGTLPTTGSSYFGGIRWRTMPGGDGGLQLGLSVTYVVQSFDFGTASAGASATGLPSVSYQAIRPGIDVRIPAGKLSILAQAGFRPVLSGGGADDVAMRFRGATTTGFDAGAGAALTLATGWEARILADYEGYFYSFQPQAGDLYRAQSAIDQMYGARIAIASVF
jgi:hypothetical protein